MEVWGSEALSTLKVQDIEIFFNPISKVIIFGVPKFQIFRVLKCSHWVSKKYFLRLVKYLIYLAACEFLENKSWELDATL